jgi:hypothetical protein
LGSEFELKARPTTKRSFLIYVLTLLFLVAGGISLVETFGVFQTWNWWLVFIPLASIIVRVFFGVLCTLTWISAAVIIWLRLSWSIMYCSIVTILLSVWHWVDRLFLTQNPLPFSRHMLALALTCIFLLFVFSSLYLVAPSMQPYQPSQKDGGSTFIQPTGEKNE